MRDVARLAGVSIATVSAVINGTAVVSPERTARVRQAMAALDYHPDQVARSLKTGKTQVVGMVIPDVANPFYAQVINGVEEAAQEAGYSLILCNSNEDSKQEQRNLSVLFSRRVDGVLIACTDVATAYDSLIRRRFPIVFFDRIPRGLRMAGVATDNVSGGYQATRHLIELGHQRIAMIAGTAHVSSHAGRVEGFRRAMQESNLPVRDEYLDIGALSSDGGLEIGMRLLGLPEPPTATFCAHSLALLGLMRALKVSGVRCPEDMSVIGFDEYAWTENFTPKLSTVAQPCHEMGRRAMQILLERMQGKEEREEVVLLEPELRVRESTAPLAPEEGGAMLRGRAPARP